MANNLVIVESAAKVNTISKFLGRSYKVEASIDHVRDLPKSQLGVDVANEYEPKYITIRGKGDLLQKMRKDAKNAKNIYLATDPDREGEAISWHLYHSLKLEGTDKKVYRITFNEITENAVKAALKTPREINMDLVDAQQARRILDRLVGYEISPILWKKIRKGLSAGRVQSVTLRLICDREKAIREFIEEEYWSIESNFKMGKTKGFEAKLDKVKGEKIDIRTEEEVNQIIKACEGKAFNVISHKKSERTRNTVLPFTTSTLQQEAAKYLGFSTQKTMNIAQQLYEGIKINKKEVGVVTYIRTDSVRLADSAKEMAKEYITSKFGEEYLGIKKEDKSKNSNIQDAHEAIRPTYLEYEPIAIKEYLSRDQYKLYNMIWNRFIASQMAPAKFESYAVKVQNGDYLFKATYAINIFEGFLKVYNLDGSKKKNNTKITVKEGDTLECINLSGTQHFTQPPARFSEASIVKALEENGVGRPSTYAPTITTLLGRGYVTKENKVLYPSELGEIVNGIMVDHFQEIVSVEFTAQLEKVLDEIAGGNVYWKEIIKAFYPNFHSTVEKAEEEIEDIDMTEETDIPCEKCGANMVVKYGKYGKFLGCPNFPDCNSTKPWYQEVGIDCPICGGKVILKKTKKGRIYYGCENNTQECEFMSWQKPTGEKCPVCGDVLVEKGSKKNIKVVCKNSTCNYGKQKSKDSKKDDTIV